MSDVDYCRPCSFCGTRFRITLPGLSAAICRVCLEALGGAVEAERFIPRACSVKPRGAAYVQRIADALNDWLYDCSPGWSDLAGPIEDYEAELVRHRAGMVWLDAHGFSTRDWSCALVNLARRRAEERRSAEEGGSA